MNRSLFGGFTGIAWSVAHLRAWLLDPDDDSTKPIDGILQKSLSRKSWRGSYDLVSGLIGFGIYALEQLPRPLAIECLKQVIDRLDEIAERGPEGITWFTPADVLPDTQREMLLGHLAVELNFISSDTLTAAKQAWSGQKAKSNATVQKSQAYRILIRIRLPNGRESASEVVIGLRGEEDPYRVLSWRDDVQGEVIRRRTPVGL